MNAMAVRPRLGCPGIASQACTSKSSRRGVADKTDEALSFFGENYFLTRTCPNFGLDISTGSFAMPSHPLARLTKKQRKATAFRERGKRSKGMREGVGKLNPAPGRRRRPS